MKVRPAKQSDIEEVMDCVKRLKKEYFERYEIPQWQGDYPSEATFVADMEAGRLFVMHMGDCLVGFVCVGFEPDPCYAVIENGSWKHDGEYAVVHRLGVNPDWQKMSMGGVLMSVADKLCEAKGVSAVRADTHEKNISMQKLLEKCGFERRGVIHLEDGAPRLAYEKEL